MPVVRRMISYRALVISYGSVIGTPDGAVVGFASLTTVEGFALDLEGLSGFPAAIGHGTHDQVIGVEWGRQALDAMQAAGADVLYRESPMAHTIDPAFLEELKGWLAATTS